jgi:hypothetical protein
VVDVVDQATGTVRLKKKVEAADEMALDTRSTRTVLLKNEGPQVRRVLITRFQIQRAVVTGGPFRGTS